MHVCDLYVCMYVCLFCIRVCACMYFIYVCVFMCVCTLYACMCMYKYMCWCVLCVCTLYESVCTLCMYVLAESVSFVMDDGEIDRVKEFKYLGRIF